MKSFHKIWLITASVLFLHSCIDTEEIITINEDNSGTYAFSMDMGGMLEMTKALKEGKEDDGKVKEKKDTLIHFKDLMNPEAGLTDHEKELYKEATLKVKLDEENAEMKILMQCPFKKMDQLPEIKENLFKIAKKLKAMDKASGKNKEDEPESEQDAKAEKIVNPGSAEHKEFIAKPGKISFTVTNSKDYNKDLMGDSENNQMMEQMVALLGEVKYKTTLLLPGTVKKYNGNNATVSPDKRSVSFITNLKEMMENPEKMGYLVEY